MKTTINNTLRVYQVITSTSHQFFCNIEQLNEVVNSNELKAGYFKINHFWNNKAQKVSKKDLKSFFEGSQLTPEHITELKPNNIAVFGSNIKGAHGAGFAYYCYKRFGAILGQSEGLQGQSYAINTMSGLDVMQNQIERFISFAKLHSETTFLVTLIGTGIAGYKPNEIAPLFAEAIEIQNIHLPKSFWNILTQ